jgi:hypothetical protein
METMPASSLTLFFNAEEREAAELIRQACEKSVPLIHERWGLDPPQDCRVYVMTSWSRFVFHSAPWQRKLLFAVLLPFWALRARKLWRYAGGWVRSYGTRVTVGVKPPRLVQLGDSSIGDRIFVPAQDVYEKVQLNTCHELVHAFTDHLGLPVWLHEGLAMVTVDRFAGKPTVRNATLEPIERWSHHTNPGGSEELRLEDPDAVVYLYVRGYWLTRYVEETRPALLKGLLSRSLRSDELESEIAAAYGKGREEFWREIDGMLVARFAQAEGTA